MAGLGIKLYTDEDVHVRLAEQLLRVGYDVLSCRAAGNAGQGLSDELQLSHAVRYARAILVHNLRHYVTLHATWQAQGREHFGIILVDRIPVGELVRRTTKHLDTYTPQEQYNQILWLAR